MLLACGTVSVTSVDLEISFVCSELTVEKLNPIFPFNSLLVFILFIQATLQTPTASFHLINGICA